MTPGFKILIHLFFVFLKSVFLISTYITYPDKVADSGIFLFPWSKTKNYVGQWQRSVQKTQIDSPFVKVKSSYFKRVTVNYVIYSQISKIIWDI